MKINVVIFITLILLPSLVLASLPTTTAFDRHNVYVLDGFRDGGYYVIRQNSSYTGFMNMSHDGGNNNIFNITTYNIENITLDFDLMFERRSFLFGWMNISWEDAVASLGDDIYININSSDGLSALRFADQPNTIVRVSLDGVVIRDWARMEDIEIYTDDISSGQHEVLIEFQPYGYFTDFLVFIILIGIVILIIKWVHWILFYDEGEYYNRFGGG